MSAAALSVVLEFARAEQAGDPHAFRFVPQEYLLRSPGGGFESSQLVWNEALLNDLEAMRRPQCEPALLQRLGELLRRFLQPLGWPQQEQLILEASQNRRRVLMTFRFAAAELYALPWELLTIKSTGQHLGELPGVLLRYEWPETATAKESAAIHTTPGRILLAWSAAGGAVPAGEHQAAIAGACELGYYPFSPPRDILPHVSARSLSETLFSAQKDGNPISVLHLLCHGAKAGGTFGLAFCGDEEGSAQAIVDAGRLRQLLAPYADMVRLVVLMACDGSNPGALGNQLGSVAQTLHRSGIATVVASRYPLSVSGSVRLTEALYARLLVGPASLESAFLAAREKLAQDAGKLDWASLQLYARAADGEDTRPVVFRPYRGLAAFLPQDRRFYFGRARDVARIVKLLSSGARLVTIVGASGSGKSSMVLAGVLPALESSSAKMGDLRVAVVRPGSVPCQALSAALIGEKAPQQNPTLPGPGAAAELSGNLLRQREALAEFAATLAPRRLLLIIDQAEELFLQADRREAAALFENILYATAGTDRGVTTVLTLRADFLGLCLEQPVLAEQVRASMVLVLPMDRADLHEAIVGPAELVGLKFEEGLADALLDAILDTESPTPQQSPGASTDVLPKVNKPEGQSTALLSGVLPLLQFMLEQLWERRSGDTISWDAWRAIGGVRGAIARRADEVLALAEKAGELELVKKLFGRLVHLGEGTLDTRRRAQRDEVEAIAPGRMQPVLDRFIEARMLTADATEVTLAHEALLREWGTLRRWIDENRESLRILQSLSRDVRRYLDTGMQEDDLWHGTPLRRALVLQAEGRLQLSAAEADFLARSAAAAERQRELLLEQQRQAHDTDLGVGAKPRSFVLALLVLLVTVSYYAGLWLLPRLTQQLFMIQIAALFICSSITIKLFGNSLLSNQLNRRFVAVGLCVIPILFLNHAIGWVFDLSVPVTQLLNINTLFLVNLMASALVDSFKYLGAPAICLLSLILGCLRPPWIPIIFGFTAPACVTYLLLSLRSRVAIRDQPQ